MHCNYETRDQANESIKKYIEQFYNTIRLHSSLDYKTPEEYVEAYDNFYDEAVLEVPAGASVCNPADHHKHDL